MRRFRILVLAAGACLAVLSLAAGAPAGDFANGPCIGQSPKICPTATVGQPYSVKFTINEEGWACPKRVVSSGALPPGLNLSTDEGVASGTPTQSGSFSFYITVSYDCSPGGKSPSDQKYLINVNAGEPPKPRLVVTTPSLPDGNVNQPYTAPALTASGDTVTSWTLAGGTQLPPGLTLAPTGVISGTPTQGGVFNFTVQANGNGTSDTRSLSIFVVAPLELQSLTGKKSPAAGWTAKTTVNASLITGVKAVGGRPPYTFSSTGLLPPGITLNTATGALTGAGTSAGRFDATIVVKDATGATVSVPWRFTILPLLDFIKRTALPSGKVNRAYSAQIRVRGKDARNARFAIADQIPPGLELDDMTGRLTGTLLKAGTYHVEVFAFTQNGAPISKTFTIRVRA